MAFAIRNRFAASGNLLLGVCTAALMATSVATPAHAQDATTAVTDPNDPKAAKAAADQAPAKPADDDAIVVTGIRRSLSDAIEIKRRERGVVEAVSAEEIGKLPDQSIAESIARLPGIAAQRVSGRAEIVSIRGFSPDFTTVMLNGRPQASSGFNRAVEFDQYPSEVLGSVVVYKTPDASISGMGLAGTVDMRTIRPLAHGKRAIAVNLRGQLDQGGARNDGFSKYGWRGSASYIDQNDEGTVGWMIGFAHMDSPRHTDHTKNWFYGGSGGAQTLMGQEVRATNSRDIRNGLIATLEIEPSDNIHSTLDLYYSKFTQDTTTRGAEWFSSSWVDGVTYTNVQTKDRGGVTFDVADHVTNVAPVLRWNDIKRKDNLFSVGWNTDFRVAEKTHLLADLSYSTNKRTDKDTEIFGGYGVGPLLTRVFDSYDRVIPADDFLQVTNFGLNYADANNVSLGDRSAWGGYGSEGHIKTPKIREAVTSIDVNLVHEFDNSFISSVEAGIDFTHRHKDKTVGELDLFLKNGRRQVLIDPRFIGDPTSLGFAGDLDVLGVNVTDLVNSGNYYDIVQLQDANHFNKAWDIKEDILTFKAKANIDSGDLHGNVGIQVVQQKQTSTGLRINTLVTPIQLVDVKEGAKYTDILPSLNMYYDITNHHRLRFAAAKVMARPRMDDMRANLVPSFNGNVCQNASPPCSATNPAHPWSASGGNPALEPWRAKVVDVGYEWYGGKASFFGVHAFQYWLDNYIYNQTIPVDFSGLTPPPSGLAQLPPGVPIDPIGTLTAPANGKGGWLRGVEVSGAFEFGRLTPALEGFGITASVSYSDYKLNSASLSSTKNAILPGFSKWVYDVTGYFERNGFQVRAAYRHRSAFNGEVVSLFSNLDFSLIRPDTQLDGQIGYTFQKGSRLEGLGLLLSVSNILDSPYRTYYGVSGVPTLENFEKYGRSWLLGASYHF